MDHFSHGSSDRSRSGTPGNARFTAQATTTEDLLKEQTVGLVNLTDFRKRRAEALERKEREGLNGGSGTISPGEGAATPKSASKKKRKIGAKGKLSFEVEDDEASKSSASAVHTPRSNTPADSSAANSESENIVPKKLGANSKIEFKPRVMTKSALAREAYQADLARKEFISMRDAVKATDIVIPFVFYDGTNVPGGRCRVKKGDHIWLFLDKARKVGAELGVGGDKSRRDWARVSVDDLMLVKGEVIVPHHYEFYHFLFNKAKGFDGLIFGYSAETTKASPAALESDPSEQDEYDPLDQHDKKDKQSLFPDEELEGYKDDPAVTKVVDRRWYERNKHIYPASVWEEYNPEKTFTRNQRKDTEGNAFFFS